jgi:hypothetical protein
MHKDRREYYKEWRNNNVDKIKKYKEDNEIDYAEHSANYRIKHPERVLCSMAKRRAKDKGLEFNIDRTDIDIPIICPILGIPIVKVYIKGKNPGPTSNSPSLDRIDNSKGYVKGNVRVISHKANTMKHNASPIELIRFAEWVLFNFKNS